MCRGAEEITWIYNTITAPNSQDILNGIYCIEGIWLKYLSPITFCIIS